MTRLESLLTGIAAGCLVLLAVHNIVTALITADPVRHEAARVVLEAI
ncbi:hypothetical protein [Selenomonas ruminantium]|nr:hypothetical protein [Selenomonas ruminantium]